MHKFPLNHLTSPSTFLPPHPSPLTLPPSPFPSISPPYPQLNLCPILRVSSVVSSHLMATCWLHAPMTQTSRCGKLAPPSVLLPSPRTTKGKKSNHAEYIHARTCTYYNTIPRACMYRHPKREKKTCNLVNEQNSNEGKKNEIFGIASPACTCSNVQTR